MDGISHTGISPNHLEAMFESSSVPQYFLPASGKLNSEGQSLNGSQNLQDVHEISISLQQNDEHYGELDVNDKSLDLVNERDVPARYFAVADRRAGSLSRQRGFSFADSQRANSLGNGALMTSAQQLASAQKSENVE
jgi:hypothetical protein